jgi:4-hydroxybenzoate polyprenyltransferase
MKTVRLPSFRFILHPSSFIHSSTLRAYAELVRLPNIFTAFADICLGWSVAQATGTAWSRWPSFTFLGAGSACLYAGGMVWNDFFDIEQDRRERPFRPLPSGRVTRRAALFLGVTLLGAGLVLVSFGGWIQDGFDSLAPELAAFLLLAILLYDGWLKATFVGPAAMGLCRFLNVLLGLTLVQEVQFSWLARTHLAAVVGLYIVGVTWFARKEAGESARGSLAAAAGVSLAALVLALGVGVYSNPAGGSFLFPYLLLGLGFFIGIPAARAISRPAPSRVQAAVKRALLGLVVLDAALAVAIAGAGGLLILLLLIPVLNLARWLYTT